MHLQIPTSGNDGERHERFLKSALWGLSIFTMVMTVPQVLTVWLRHEAAGVSPLSWGAYLLSALVWLFYGVRRRDPNIYVPCIGWIVLDAAVVIGAVIYG
jgi:uncharacterized protein with PQ loop repeat